MDCKQKLLEVNISVAVLVKVSEDIVTKLLRDREVTSVIRGSKIRSAKMRSYFVYFANA